MNGVLRKDYFLLFSLFFFSLVNYTYVSLLCAFLFGVLYLILNISEIKVGLSELVLFTCLIFLLIFYGSLSLWFPDVYLVQNIDKDIYPIKLMLRVLLLVCIFIYCVSFDLNRLAVCIEFILKLNILVFVSQIFIYYTFGTYVDYTGIITGEEQRVMFGGYFRSSGLYAEPSNYAMVVSALVVSLIYLRRRKQLLIYTAIITIILTLSTAAFLSGIILLLLFFLFSTDVKMKHLLAISPILLLVLLYGWKFFLFRFQIFDSVFDSGAYIIRKGLFDYAFSREFFTTNFLFGDGLFSFDYKRLVSVTKFYTTASIDDAGVIISIIIRFGMVGGCLILLLLLYILRSYHNILFFIPLVLMKFSLFGGVFFIPIISAYVYRRSVKYNESCCDSMLV